MKALRLTQWGRPAELRETPIPEPGPDQVLLKIAGAGACHSDLHLMDWPEGQLPWRLPFTLGHENAGWVEQVGPGVTSLRKGDAVLAYGPWGCGLCRPCRLGRENYCERAGEIGVAGGGLGLDGGMAEYMLVPSARFVVPIGDLDPVQAAPLADAALTELVLDMVGADSTLALGAKVLRAEGRLVIIGLSLGTLPVTFFALPYGARSRQVTGALRPS